MGVYFFVILLRFVPISFGDLYSDGAHYSFRAYGWLDWLGKGGQSTPFDWFDHLPFWSYLSFHDAPPLVFLIQNIFFKFLGDNIVVVRLPFVFAGIGSIVLFYFLLKKISGNIVASIATILFSFVSYSIWAEHSVYLEGVQSFFIVASVLFGGLYLFKDRSDRYLYMWIAFLALALLAKYTALFLIPPILICCILERKFLEENWKKMIVAIIIFLLLLSPLVIYNLEIYKSRRHFDMAISSMFGIDSQDFGLVKNRTLSLNIDRNFIDIFSTLSANISLPLLLLGAICLIFLLWRLCVIGMRNFESWILCNLFFLIVLFSFAGALDRYLSIAVPFLVLIISLGLVHIYEQIKNYKVEQVFIVIAVVVFVFETFYSINTNLLKNPIGFSNFTYSKNKIQSLGFNQLDNFIRHNIIIKLPEMIQIKNRKDININNDNVERHSVVLYDDRINWFAQMWYFQKYLIFHRWPILSTSYLDPESENGVDIRVLMAVSGEPFYFIFPIDTRVIDPLRDDDDNINYIGPAIAQELETISEPVAIVKNDNNEPMFKIYKIDSF